jgi:hypothetical protein
MYVAALRGDKPAFHRCPPGGLVVELASPDNQFCWWLANCHARMGEVDGALHWIGEAIRLGFWNHRFWAEVNPLLVPLRASRS